MASSTIQLDPSIYDSFTDPGAVDWNGNYQTGTLQDYFTNNYVVGRNSGGPNAISREGDFQANQFQQNMQRMQESGFDPNGQYLWGTQRVPDTVSGAGGDRGQLKWGQNLYQQGDDSTWNPISSTTKPHRGLNAMDLAKVISLAAGFMTGGAGLLGGAGLAGTGLSASGAGAATGSGLGYAPGAGLSLAAPTAGATGAGLYVPALAGGVGAGAGAGLASLYDSPNTFGDYSLTSASDFAPSGGDGLSMGDYNLGDGYSGVFDSLTSPGISDYGNINLSSTGPQSFSGDIGTGVSESNALLDNVRKRLGQQFTGARGGRNLLDLMRRGVGVYNANKQMKANNAASGGLQQQVKTLQDMFTPGGAYAQQLRQQLERRDAAAGRRSQYGPREAELMAALARENARMAPSLASIYNQQSNIQNQNFGLRNQRDNVILEAIGRPVSNLIGDMAGPGIRGGLDFLGSLFGG